MMAAYLLIGISMLVLGASALVALLWAARTGQFSDMRGGAKVIFDEDEPIGKPTDIVFKRRDKKDRAETRTAQSKEIS